MPYTLLLADDSATIQRVIELTFADEDVTVVAVSDGEEAIARLEASPPDIVLADVDMPGKNGYDVALYIQRSPRLCHIPVVLLTGAFEPVDQALADGAGCEGVLAKPFEPQHVIGRVKELLARRRRGFEDVATVSDVAAVGDGEFPPPSLVPHQAPPTPAAGSIWRWPVSDDETAAPSVDPELAEEPTEAASRNGRDDYFDLDAAFSMLTSDPAVGAVPPAAPHPDPPPTADVDWFDSKVAEIVAAEPWDDIPVAPEVHPHADLPLTYEPAPSESSVGSEPEPEPSFSAPPPIEAVVETTPAVPPDANAPPDDRLAPIEESQPVEPEPLAVAAEAAPEAAQPPAPKPALPALADAFAALLAAEHGEPLPARSGLWPSTLAPSAEMREELVEQVVRRVLDRLSDTVVREAVADVVSTVAERLIREEIERIKASIK